MCMIKINSKQLLKSQWTTGPPCVKMIGLLQFLRVKPCLFQALKVKYFNIDQLYLYINTIYFYLI